MTSLASGIARLGLLAAAIGCAWPIDAAAPEPSTPAAFDATAIGKGAELAALGDCIVCHTAPAGRAYAGGRAVPTPFGTIYGTNITPDRETGIGQWSEADFARAMREGVDRAGRQLYPAFSYDHFRHLADADIHALYAFFMTREPVSFRPPANELRFPFNIRPLVAVWKLLFLHRDAVPADARQGAEWNRGAYLVAGLGHCGGCHTPRNAMGAEKTDRALSGGEAEGWHAPALDGAARTPVPWSIDAMTAYLRGAVVGDHEVAGGPMQPVTRNLAAAPEADVRVIATYIVSLQPRAPSASSSAPAAAAAADNRQENHPGAIIYRGACAMCHGPGRAVADGALRFGFTTSLREPTPRNLVQIVLHGIMPPPDEPGPWMPAFGGALTDAQIGDLAGYLRARFAPDAPAWQNVQEEASKVRRNPEAP